MKYEYVNILKQNYKRERKNYSMIFFNVFNKEDKIIPLEHSMKPFVYFNKYCQFRAAQ